MTTVGLAHAFSVVFLSLVVAVVYSINMQGWRSTEPLAHAVTRRFLKLFGLLLYLALVVHLLTAASEASGTSQTVYAGIGTALCAVLVLAVFFPNLFARAPEEPESQDTPN